MLQLIILFGLLEYGTEFSAGVSRHLFFVVSSDSIIFVVDLVNEFSVAGFISICDLLMQFLHPLVNSYLVKLDALLLAELIVGCCVVADLLVVKILALLLDNHLLFLLFCHLRLA